MSEFRHHKYVYTRPFTFDYHLWELVGARGAIHFAAHINAQDQHAEASCGLEFHHLTGDGAPDHVNCRLTGGRCWHDGTSLYATEQLWPVIKGLLENGNHQQIFRTLEHEYRSHFRHPTQTPHQQER